MLLDYVIVRVRFDFISTIPVIGDWYMVFTEMYVSTHTWYVFLQFST